MRAVRLNRRLDLQASVKTADGAGGFREDWVVLGQLWAEVRLRSGRDRTARVGRVSETDYRITLRASPVGAPSRPEAGQRLVEGSRRFLIEAVGDADHLGRYLVCFAREEVSA